MASPQERLISLIEYAKQSALLKAKPPMQVTQHQQFNRFEEKIKGLPGAHFNDKEDEFDEIWLRLKRLHESRPPVPESKLLEAWLDLPASPFKEPSLKFQVSRDNLIAIGDMPTEVENDTTPPENTEPRPQYIVLSDYAGKEAVEGLLKAYLSVIWRPWAEQEKEVRKSIGLYSDLFMVAQQLQGNLLDSQLELVWGVGIASWITPNGALTYPLMTQLVEISLNEKTMALEIRPRLADPRLELDAYATMDNPGVSNLDQAFRDFYKANEAGLNPFETSSFEAVLKSAASLLDASGIYWPNQSTADDRSVPRAGDNLVVTDTWVIFARPRTSSLFIQDLQRFGATLADSAPEIALGAAGALVTDPASTAQDATLPAFRGLSLVGSSGDGCGGGKAAELYFPMSYNDEQVQIIQMLEAHDGVVVQGPPGTGKTHTIANVICHYLALGKRVLVTSMKDPALAVLQEKLPESIRPLAVSLLTSEADGMKQFEFAINKIASEITRINKAAYRQEIQQIDGQIDSLHGQINKADKDIATWAKRNLDKILIDAESLTPVEATEAVAINRDEVSWFPDTLTIEPTYRAQFNSQDIVALRTSRQSLGADLAYLGKKVPQLADFPETARLLQVHRDLSRLADLKALENQGTVPSLVSGSPETLKLAMSAASQVSNLRLLHQDIENARQNWTAGLQHYLRSSGPNEILDLFLGLKAEITELLATRTQFLSRPVTVPENMDENAELVAAVRNQVHGQKPFGLAGLFGKSEQKKLLDAITVVGTKPNSLDTWRHVQRYLEFQTACRAALVRWNTLADEISLLKLETKPDRIVAAGLAIELFNKVAASISAEREVARSLKGLMPTWVNVSTTPYSTALLAEAESILTHHLTRNRLAETWVVKESFHKALAGCNGEITDQIWSFMNSKLGQSSVTEAEIQNEWSRLTEEIRRVAALAPQLKVVADGAALVESSGAPKWAKLLRTEACIEAHDRLLPDNWKEVWRLVRLVNFVDSIDGRQELRRLSNLRSALEGDLAKQYKDAVAKRTWLRLAENATHDVSAALEAYRIAIKKIGKGTGVKAGRYRHDARIAADKANSAIPCWIMPHYRICESLPAQLGCFDLVIIDEASQSDLTALPALLRAQKVLIVGDDKQVSPEGIGLEEDKIRNLMSRFLADQVDIYRPQMAPDRSIYDLFKVVFAKSAVMLREHFRCVAPIIEYSKREFYNHELQPLRMPKASERMDPPLIDVHVLDGYRNNQVNNPEARFIVDEIRLITENPAYAGRTIGVVSLLGSEQALSIMKMINEELGEQVTTQYKITCGDARTFQGKERDIMFLSMVASPGQAHAQGSDMFAQRFNVAASRARDRMYLVRSVGLDDLSTKDVLRTKLIQHFHSPFLQSEDEVEDLRAKCESPFEREVFDILAERGYRVIPQVPVGSFRIDMVVEGDNDNRLAIECDGDRYHGPAQWDADMRRQRILERAGWKFWRSFASTFVMHRDDVVRDLLAVLAAMGIQPTTGGAPVKSIHAELREIVAYPATDAAPEEQPDLALDSDECLV